MSKSKSKRSRRRENLRNGYWSLRQKKNRDSRHAGTIDIGLVKGESNEPLQEPPVKETKVAILVTRAGDITVRTDTNEMTVPELRKRASALGIKGAHKMRRQEVIDALVKAKS
jgi:hypothetical protein